MGKHPHGHHARPLVDLGFKRQRIGDGQALHVQNVLAVVGHQRLSVLEAQAGLSTHSRKTARNVVGRHWDHFHWQRKLAQGLHQLGFVCDTHKAFGQSCHDLLAGQCSTAALDHVALAVDFVGAVDIDGQ